jgi:hypothetical protein
VLSNLRWIGAAVLLAGVWNWNAVGVARAQDDTSHDESAQERQAAQPDDEDVEAGELGTLDDDANAPAPRRRRGSPRVSPPKFVLDASARGAIAYRFSKEFSAELFTRAQLGAITDPVTTRSSRVGGGLILNRSIEGFVWSNTIELSQHQRDFYRQLSYESYELTTAVARPIKFRTSGWSVIPRIAVGYLWATDRRADRTKTELMAPVSYQLTKQLDLTFTPRLDWQVYSDRPDGRRDWTGYLGVGFKYEWIKGINLAASIGYETRSSNVAQANVTAWKLAPQLNLKKEF